MRYQVTFESGLAVVVELRELPGGRFVAHVDGRPVELDPVDIGNRLSVLVGARVIDLATEGTPPELNVFAQGRALRVRVETDAMRSDRRASAHTERREVVVYSPMPGRVVKVLVSEGDAVQLGQGIVVLEAMKMENEVRARAPGTVAKVHVATGSTVEGRVPLVTLV